MNLVSILSTSNYIIYNKEIAKKYGVEEAILLGVLCSYQNTYKDEWFYKEEENIAEDTCLSVYAIRRAKQRLQEIGVVEIVKKGLPAKHFFRIVPEKLLTISDYGTPTTSGYEMTTTCDSELNTTCTYDFATVNNNNDNNKKNSIKNNQEKIYKKERFQIPSLEEVEEYCEERRNNVDAQYFIDYYTSKGWLVGKSPMKDWKASIRLWERKDKPRNKLSKEDEEYYDSLG